MPESLAPDPQRWEGTLRDTIGVPDENMILVAHSLGALTALRHLASQSEPWRLGTLVLIAGFLDRLPALPELDAYIGDGCDVGQIAHRVNRLAVFRSDDDAFVPAGHTDRLADLLGTTAQVVPGAGHFLAEEGVTTLPPVLKAIEPDIPPSLTAD
jgi:predicted alpha/beta hydrolase family esterase